ncbi:22658_t:CDS:2, partial [Entrophospora sp. SA101]
YKSRLKQHGLSNATEIMAGTIQETWLYMNGMCLKCRDEDTGTGRNIGVNSAQSDVKVLLLLESDLRNRESEITKEFIPG